MNSRQTGRWIVTTTVEKIVRSEEEWRPQRTRQQYRETRQAGTERAFTGPYWNERRAGLYHCLACGAPLCRSKANFDRGAGWPSFTAPIAVAALTDHGHGVTRTELRCATR